MPKAYHYGVHLVFVLHSTHQARYFIYFCHDLSAYRSLEEYMELLWYAFLFYQKPKNSV